MKTILDSINDGVVEITNHVQTLGCTFRVTLSYDANSVVFNDETTQRWNLCRLTRALLSAVGQEPQSGHSTTFVLDLFDVKYLPDEPEECADSGSECGVPVLETYQMRAEVLADATGQAIVLVEFIGIIPAR